MNKKLQVFVSSTYTDLIDERQAAVEAILDAGHIPAGMELFKAGNESQLKTIYKWIDESDVYMLILGGRYGSVEQKSGKSYTQLEYEYALSKDIPVFAVVLSESFLINKISTLGLPNVMEQVEPGLYKKFKTLVMSKIIRAVDDCKDIKITIHSTLNEFMNEYDLLGWVRNTGDNNSIQLLQENNTLIKENNSLYKQIQKLEEKLSDKEQNQFGKYSFDELVKIFNEKKFVIPAKYTKSKNDVTIDALEFFKLYFNSFVTGITNAYNSSEDEVHIFYHVSPYYVGFDFLERVKLSGTNAQRIHTTKLGASFYAMLEVKGMINK